MKKLKIKVTEHESPVDGSTVGSGLSSDQCDNPPCEISCQVELDQGEARRDPSATDKQELSPLSD